MARQEEFKEIEGDLEVLEPESVGVERRVRESGVSGLKAARKSRASRRRRPTGPSGRRELS